MGLFGSDNNEIARRKRTQLEHQGRATDTASTSGIGGAATVLIEKVVAVGVEGRGPLASAHAIAARAMTNRDERAAVREIIRSHQAMGALGGFVTGLGGFFTMAMALPANILEFYVVATRMVAATAVVRGYDIDDPAVRTAILLTLVGGDSEDILRKAGVQLGGGKLVALASRGLPAPALMVLNKAIGFRLLKRAGEQTLARLGRAVPLAGGGIGAALDTYLLGRIAATARREFPQR